MRRLYAAANRKRTRLMRVFVRVDGDVLKACYDGVEHTITTNPQHDSITFPRANGTFCGTIKFS